MRQKRNLGHLPLNIAGQCHGYGPDRICRPRDLALQRPDRVILHSRLVSVTHNLPSEMKFITVEQLSAPTEMYNYSTYSVITTS